MADLKKVRKRLIVVSGVLAATCVLAGLYVVVPVGPTNPDLYKDLEQTRTEYEVKEQQVKPLRGLPQKLVASHNDIERFYQTRFPARQTAISEEIGRLAIQNKVTLSDVRYEDFDTEIPDLRAVLLEAQLSGEYERVARFINSVERDKTFFLVDGLSLDDQKAGTVRLQLNLETYLRPGSAGDNLLAPKTKSSNTKKESHSGD